MSIYLLIFLAGILYNIIGVFLLARLDQKTHGRALSWVAGALMLEFITLVFWPVAFVIHALDRLLSMVLRREARERI